MHLDLKDQWLLGKEEPFLALYVNIVDTMVIWKWTIINWLVNLLTLRVRSILEHKEVRMLDQVLLMDQFLEERTIHNTLCCCRKRWIQFRIYRGTSHFRWWILAIHELEGKKSGSTIAGSYKWLSLQFCRYFFFVIQSRTMWLDNRLRIFSLYGTP